MRAVSTFVIGAMLLAGCAGDAPTNDLSNSMADADGDGFVDAVEIKYGSDPHNATSMPDVMMHKDISFSTTVTNVVGTGVPSVQCPADQVNSKTVVWTIVAPEGNVSDVHAAMLEFTITGTATVNDADLFVYGPEGGLIGSGTGSTASETVTVNGHQPIGDYTIEVRGCSGVGNVNVDAKGMLGWIPSTEDLLASDMHAHAEGEEPHSH